MAMNYPAALASLALLLAASASQAQVLFYNFDETGTSAANGGSAGSAQNLTLRNASGTATDFHSGSGLGVGGLSGDRALDLSSATGMGSAGTGPYASSGTAGSVFNSATSFTIAGWYNAASAPATGARLLQSGNLIVFFNANTYVAQLGANTISVNASGGAAAGSATKVSGATSSTLTTPSSQWVFFALTYDGTATNKSLTFYQGDADAASALRSYSFTYTTTNAALGNGAGLSLGGNVTSGSNVRPFDGLIDDFGVWASTSGAGGALDAAAINDFRLAAIPEPASYGVIVAAFAGLLVAARRKRRASA